MTLSEFKAARKLTLSELSVMTGIPVSTLNGWMLGKRKPALDQIPRICTATDGLVTAADMRPDLASLMAPAA